jgi:hypothetical protein
MMKLSFDARTQMTRLEHKSASMLAIPQNDPGCYSLPEIAKSGFCAQEDFRRFVAAPHFLIIPQHMYSMYSL